MRVNSLTRANARTLPGRVGCNYLQGAGTLSEESPLEAIASDEESSACIHLDNPPRITRSIIRHRYLAERRGARLRNSSELPRMVSSPSWRDLIFMIAHD
jgi:hypothetical protein